MGWIAGRVYRQKITIQEGNVFADHTDFPVAIKITGANEVFTKAQSNGYDILFSNDAEELLSYERVRWDPGSQILVVYVKTDLSSTEGTVLYMYYGNGGNTITIDGQDGTGVWASHYKGVYHFEEASGQLQDATSNARNSTTANQVKYHYAGLFSYACYFDGSGDYFILPSSLAITGGGARTVTAYFYPEWAYNQMGTWSSLLILGGQSSTRNAWIMSLDNGSECSPTESIGLHYWATNTCTGERVVTSGDEILTSTWHQYAGTHDGSTTQRVYLNGTQRGTSSYTLNTLAGTPYFGGRANGNYRGRLSEIRVSNTDLGSDWVRTEYENMINNNTFFVLSAEEDTPYLIEDIPTAITIFDAANSLDGARNYLTEFTIGVTSTVYYDMPTDLSLADMVQTTSGINNIDVELGLAGSGTLADTERDTNVDFFVSSSGILGTDAENVFTNFTVGQQPIPITDPYGGVDIRSELAVGYLVTPSGYGEDVDVEFGIGTTYDTESNLDVDFSIATSTLFNYETEIFCSTFSGTYGVGDTWLLGDYYETDVTVSGGLSYPINVDVFSSVSGTQYNMEADLYISLANTTPSGLPQGTLISGSYFSTDVTTSGGLSYPLETDLYVSLANSVSGQIPIPPSIYHTSDYTVASGGYFSADMRLFALQIDNFFLDVDEYVTSTATMYVDITDKRGILIDTTDCYFIIDGVPVTSGIWFTPVERPTASGYRMYYDPPGDFIADDSTEVIVHAENVINDWLEQTYYLLWGYNLIVNATELHSWGWDKEVIVWSTASNLARCPAESADAWHFRTAPKPFKDLSASIVPQVKHKDLSAVIYPISTAIYYDGTYKITVNLKDSAGNEMPPFILEFTVEDKPN